MDLSEGAQGSTSMCPPMFDDEPPRRAVASKDNTFSATRLTSPRPPRVLPQGRQLQGPQELHFVLQLDAELLHGAAPSLGHERDRVGRTGTAGVLDEVRVPRGNLRAADPVTLEPASLEQPARAELVRRVLEHAAVGSLVRRLCCLSPCLHGRDGGLDLVDRPGRQPKLDLCDDVAVTQVGLPIAKPELLAGSPFGPAAGEHERALENPGPVPAVCTCIHPDAPTGRTRNGLDELETTETGSAGAVERDRIGCPASGDEAFTLHHGLRELAGEFEDEPVESLVRDQQI